MRSGFTTRLWFDSPAIRMDKLIYFPFDSSLCCLNLNTAELRIAKHGRWNLWEDLYGYNVGIDRAGEAIEVAAGFSVDLDEHGFFKFSRNLIQYRQEGNHLWVIDEVGSKPSVWTHREKFWGITEEEPKPHPVELY